jgi:hypothetical protein
LNEVVFPVTYSEQFYSNVQKEGVRDVTKLAWHNDVVVGAICCRFESVAAPQATKDDEVENSNNKDEAVAPAPVSAAAGPQLRIYIMTLGLFEAPLFQPPLVLIARARARLLAPSI